MTNQQQLKTKDDYRRIAAKVKKVKFLNRVRFEIADSFDNMFTLFRSAATVIGSAALIAAVAYSAAIAFSDLFPMVQRETTFILIGLFLAVMFILSYSYFYLVYGKKQSIHRRNHGKVVEEPDEEPDDNFPDLFYRTANEYEKLFLEGKKEIEDRMNTLEQNTLFAPGAERDELVTRIVDLATQDGGHKLFEQIQKEVKQVYGPSIHLVQVRALLNAARKRLGSHAHALSRRATYNLLSGVAVTLLAISVLVWWSWDYRDVLASDTMAHAVETNNQDTPASISDSANRQQLFADVLLSSLPRLSLAIILEVFAFFFLRQYRNSLMEEKYFQNEVTNIECQQASIEGALMTASSDLKDQIFKELASTERNRILDKDQTTVDLERMKSETKQSTDVLTKVIELMKQK